MKDIKEFYILGQPIETEIGLCHFLKVLDIPEYYQDLQILALTRLHILYKFYNMNKNGKYDKDLAILRESSMFDIVSSMSELKHSYIRIFNKVFQDEEITGKITEKNFDYIRSLILRMNGMKEELINPNPEIQRAIERSRRVKSQINNDKLDFADMITSVVGLNGLTFDQVNNFTLYQLYMMFQRHASFINYDTSTLFATVSTEKVNIESWSKHIDLFAEEKHFVSHDEFKKKTGSVFKE